MDRRQILQTFAGWTVFAWIGPALEAKVNQLGTGQPEPSRGSEKPAVSGGVYAQGAANFGVWLDWYLCGWLPDKERTGFDAADWMKRIKGIGCDYVLMELKSIGGIWIYPTKDPMWNSGIAYEGKTGPDFGEWPPSGRLEPVSHNYLADLSKEAARQGLHFLGSPWVGVDSAAGIAHPDWMKRDANGVLERGFDCTVPSMASPYREYSLNCLRETRDLAPNCEAIVMDDMIIRDQQISHDTYFSQAFEKQFGKPLENGSEAERWQLQADILVKYLTDVKRVFAESGRQIQLGATSSCRYLLMRSGPMREAMERIAGQLDYLYQEGHLHQRATSWCKLLRSTGKAYEITTPGNLGWSEFVFHPWHRVALEAATVFAQGGNFATTIRPFQDGRIPKGETDNLAKAGQWLTPRRPYFVSLQPVSDAALWIGSALYREEQEATGLWPGLEQLLKIRSQAAKYSPPYDVDSEKVANGLEDALMQHHFAFDIIPLNGSFENYKLILLQDTIGMSDSTANKLRRFVENGGNLLAEGHASLVDETGNKRPNFALADVFGIDFRDYSPHVTGNYLSISDPEAGKDIPDYPLLVEGGAILTNATSAKTLARLTLPSANRLELRTAGAHNSPGKMSEFPAVTRNSFGKGQAIYIAAGIGKHISLRGDQEPWTKQLVANLMQLLVRDPLYQTDAPPAVEVVFNRQRDRYVVHFLNNYIALDGVPSSLEWPVLKGWSFRLSTSRVPKIAKAFLAPEGRAVRFQRNNTWWTFELDSLDPIDTILVIEV